MDIKVMEVCYEEKEILRNLLEKYNYEFSQYDKLDVNQFGLYGWWDMDLYWIKENRHAFFIRVDGKLAGFILVDDEFEVSRNIDYAIRDFFVMYKYRKYGVGSYAAKTIFDKYHGQWGLKCHPDNLASICFWNKVIAEYTNGKFEHIKNHPEAEYAEGTYGDVFFFET